MVGAGEPAARDEQAAGSEAGGAGAGGAAAACMGIRRAAEPARAGAPPRHVGIRELQKARQQQTGEPRAGVRAPPAARGPVPPVAQFVQRREAAVEALAARAGAVVGAGRSGVAFEEPRELRGRKESQRGAQAERRERYVPAQEPRRREGVVSDAQLDTACTGHIGLVPELVLDRELGDALVAVGSLDLSPWEVVQ